MTRPVTVLDRSDVLAGLFAVGDEIDTVLAGLTDEQWRAQSPLPVARLGKPTTRHDIAMS